MKQIILLLFIAIIFTPWALSQNDPNLSHFYMSRQQITIEDNSPIIINKTGNVNNPNQGSLPVNSPVNLPRASWQQYSPSVTNYKPNLPKVYNGVPPQAPPAPVVNNPKANLAKAQTLKNKSVKPTNVVKTYSTYKGYGGKASAVTTQTTNTTSQYGMNQTNKQINSNVNGKLLHWRPQTKNY